MATERGIRTMVTACPQCRAVIQAPAEVPAGGLIQCEACGSSFKGDTSADSELRLRHDSADLDLPILDDFDEYVEAPEVGPPVPLGKSSAFAAYKWFYHRTVGQLGTDTACALLLVLLHLMIALAYGLGEGSRIALAIPDGAIGPTPDMLTRVWKPLALYELMTAGLVASVYWLGCIVTLRYARLVFSSGSFVANWALASIPGTICLGWAWFSGWPVRSLAVPAVVVALPIVLLFTCAIFGLRWAMGGILTLVCMSMAGPVSVLSAYVYAMYGQYCSASDEQRIMALSPAESAVATTSPELPGRIPLNPRVREMAEILTLSAGGNVAASQQAIAPQATARVERSKPAVSRSESTRGITIDPWSQPEAVDLVIWPAVSAESFATLSSDALGNHAIELWSARDLSKQGSLRIAGSKASSYTLSPSGKLLVRVLSAGAPIAEVWDTQRSRRQMQMPLSGGNGTPSALGFCNEDTFAVVWRDQGRLSVSAYDLPSGKLNRSIAWPDAEKHHGATDQGSPVGQPVAVWLNRDGTLLAGADAVPRVAVLEVSTGRLLQQWPMSLPAGQVPAVSGIAFAPSNETIAVLLDENPDNAQSVLLIAEPAAASLTAIPFANVAWRLAGCPGPSAKRGRVIDWISDTELLLYGELVVDVNSGALTRTMRVRQPGVPPRDAASSQYPLPDGSFLLEMNSENPERKSTLHWLRMKPSH